jgi:hypothetical protein
MTFTVQGNVVIDDNSRLSGWRLTNSVISTATNATAGTMYVATAPLTLTLPASPTQGDVVGFANVSGTCSCVIAGNGQKIMSNASNLTVDRLNASFVLQYTDATRGWIFVL